MKSKRVFLVTFGHEDDILGAVKAARAEGFDIIDTFTPYAVHGLDDAMGLPQSKLPAFTFVFGLCGAALMLWFQLWASWVDWPINVGGKPWNSIPSFVPAKFEIVVLFAGVGTFLTFLAARRLYPGKKGFIPVPEVTDNMYTLMLGEKGAALDVAEFAEFFKRFNAINTEARLVEGTIV